MWNNHVEVITYTVENVYFRFSIHKIEIQRFFVSFRFRWRSESPESDEESSSDDDFRFRLFFFFDFLLFFGFFSFFSFFTCSKRNEWKSKISQLKSLCLIKITLWLFSSLISFSVLILPMGKRSGNRTPPTILLCSIGSRLMASGGNCGFGAQPSFRSNFVSSSKSSSSFGGL